MSPSIRVLHVDDDERFASLCADVLERDDDRFEVTTAHGAAEALDVLQDDRVDIDCVVSDYRLPERNGLDILEAVRADHPALPFILFTGRGSEEVASEAISAGVTDYMRKEDNVEQFDILARRIANSVSQYRAEREAERTKRQLQELTTSTTDCLWMFTREWDELLFISGYEEVWGRSPEDLKSNPREFLEGVHADDRVFVEAAMERLSSGEAIDIEYRITKADGESGWVWVKGQPISDDDGTVVRVVGFTRDITERKERQRELRRNERRFEATFNDPNILVGLLDTAGTVIDINETALEYIDTELEAFRGRPLWETPWFTGSESAREDVKGWIDRAASGEYVDFELDLSDSFEDDLIVSGVFRPVVDDAGEVTAVLISDRDVTEQRKRQWELELRTQAMNEAPVGITMSDPSLDDNPLVYANEKFLELTGYPQEEALGRNCRFLQGAETDENAVAKMREGIANEEPVTVEVRNYRKDGTMFWNRVSIAPVHGEGGELSNYIGFQETITERKQRQQQLQVLDRVLRHNLRNKISIIRSRTETLRSNRAADVSLHTEHIIETCDELMDIAEKERLITQSLSEQREREVDLGPALRQAATSAGRDHPDASIDIDCPDGLTLWASPHIERAFEELLTNALRHTDASSPGVTVAAAAGDGTVRIEIEDTWPSMPEMERDVLHGPDETPLYHGGGLGLWFVNLVITQSGGTVAVEDNERGGNTIRIEFPD